MNAGNDTILLRYQAIGTNAIEITSSPHPFSASITKGNDWLRFYNNTVGVYLIDPNLLNYNGGFNLDYNENDTCNSRSGEITVVSGSLTKKITVNQSIYTGQRSYFPAIKYVNTSNPTYNNTLILQYTIRL